MISSSLKPQGVKCACHGWGQGAEESCRFVHLWRRRAMRLLEVATQNRRNRYVAKKGVCPSWPAQDNRHISVARPLVVQESNQAPSRTRARTPVCTRSVSAAPSGSAACFHHHQHRRRGVDKGRNREKQTCRRASQEQAPSPAWLCSHPGLPAAFPHTSCLRKTGQ